MPSCVCRWIAGLSMILVGVAGVRGQQKAEFHFGYRPPAFHALKAHIADVDLVTPETFVVDGSGLIAGEIEPRVLRLARVNKVRVMPQLKNFDASSGAFRADWVERVLTHSAARRRAIDGMVQTCRTYALYGMQIEFEGFHIDQREAFTEFCRDAAAALHAEGYKFSVSLIHREEEAGGPTTYTQWMMKDWRGAYDLEALGAIADFVKVVAYAQHTRRTPPGPSQSYPWLERVVQYFLSVIPAEKIRLGLSMGASHYYTVADPERYYQNARSWSRSITIKEVESLLDQYGGSPLQWDDRQKMSFGTIERGGVLEWFIVDNDLRAIGAKINLVRKYHLGGVTMWISGDEHPGLWDRVKLLRSPKE